jgi:3-oxoacyl-[acyl-carrier protein] reductase
MVVGQQKEYSMHLNLNSKKVLITGASKGIGLAIAESFLQEDAKTCLVSRGSNALFKNEKKLQNDFGLKNTFAYKCDCTNIESLNSLKDEIGNRWGDLDVVVVNVGDGRSVPDALPDNEQWQQTWNSNFESALQTARIFLPMLKKSEGCLLFVSSIAGIEAFGAPTDYSTAKSAIIALAKNMARKLATDNVRVNVVAPGNVYFKGSSWDDKIQKDKCRVDEIIKSTVPMNRFATPQEIADSAVFLCSDRASFITGATLVVDGGQTTGVF